jgi:hypothetical protein
VPTMHGDTVLCRVPSLQQFQQRSAESAQDALLVPRGSRLPTWVTHPWLCSSNPHLFQLLQVHVVTVQASEALALSIPGMLIWRHGAYSQGLL